MRPGFRSFLLLALIPSLLILSGGLTQIVVTEIPDTDPITSIVDGQPDPREPKIVLGDKGRPAFYVDTGDALNPKAAAGEIYAVYYDGRGTGSFLCGTLTGFDAYSMTMSFVFPQPCTIELSALLYSADVSDPSCPKPGTLLCSSASSSTFSIPVAGTYALTVPIDCECALLDDQYFWAMKIVAEDCASGPFVTTSSGPASVCHNYVDTGSGFSDLTTLFPSWPGDIVISTNGVCCEDVVGSGIESWGRVKSDFGH